jgi:hypothetical protein
MAYYPLKHLRGKMLFAGFQDFFTPSKRPKSVRKTPQSPPVKDEKEMGLASRQFDESAS